jgi:hypothetical protein
MCQGNTASVLVPTQITSPDSLPVMKIKSGGEFFLFLTTNFTCFGKLPMDPTICSGNGICIGLNNCSCAPNSLNEKCEYTCFGINSTDPRVCSGNGVCQTTDFCKCNYGDGNECRLNNGTKMFSSGRNTAGEVGDNSMTTRLTHVEIPIASGVTKIHSGDLHYVYQTNGSKLFSGGNNNVF